MTFLVLLHDHVRQLLSETFTHDLPGTPATGIDAQNVLGVKLLGSQYLYLVMPFVLGNIGAYVCGTRTTFRWGAQHSRISKAQNNEVHKHCYFHILL